MDKGEMGIETVYIKENINNINKELVGVSMKCQLENQNYVYINRGDYFSLKGLYDDFTIIAARNSQRNEIVGYSICITYNCVDKGKPEKVMYVTDTSIVPSSRKGFVLYHLMKAVHRYFIESDSRFCITITGKHNDNINNIMGPRKANLFPWVKVKDMQLLNLSPMKKFNLSGYEYEISHVKKNEELEKAFNYVNNFYTDYRFYRPLSNEMFNNEKAKLKLLDHKNIIVAKKNRKIVGVLFYFDPSEIAKIIIAHYKPILDILVKVLRKSKRILTFLPSPPRLNESLRSLYVRYFAYSDRNVFTCLIYYLCNLSYLNGYHTICLNTNLLKHEPRIYSPFIFKVKDDNNVWVVDKDAIQSSLDTLLFNHTYIDTSILF